MVKEPGRILMEVLIRILFSPLKPINNSNIVAAELNLNNFHVKYQGILRFTIMVIEKVDVVKAFNVKELFGY